VDYQLIHPSSTLWTSVVDNGVLDAVRAWLEPMEATAALPAVGIQSALFEVLPKMDLDTATLKESRLGPIVLFYTKTKRVTPAISRAADALVQAWSRPIVKRPGEFRPRHEEGGPAEGNQGQGQSQNEGTGGAPGSTQRRRRFDAATAIKENHGRKGARMPQVKVRPCFTLRWLPYKEGCRCRLVSCSVEVDLLTI
jgi:transcription factor SPN1